jgi:hypothetical protein
LLSEACWPHACGLARASTQRQARNKWRTDDRPQLSPDATRFKNVAKANVRTYLDHIAKHCPDDIVRTVIAGGLHSMAAFAVQRYGGRARPTIFCRSAADAHR